MAEAELMGRMSDGVVIKSDRRTDRRWQCVSGGGRWLLLDSVHADISVGEMKQECRRMTAARCNIVFYSLSIFNS
jgi:hypothetical protein